MLKDKNWGNVLLNRDQDSAFNFFFESIDNCFEISFPEKKLILPEKIDLLTLGCLKH